MRIAVTYEHGQVFQHFGHTAQFKLYDIKEGTIKDVAIIDTVGSGHGALADFLKEYNVNTVICGGIGDGAKQALTKAGITLYGGVTGDPDTVVQDLLAGKLVYNPDVVCSHHGDNHQEEGHDCGKH